MRQAQAARDAIVEVGERGRPAAGSPARGADRGTDEAGSLGKLPSQRCGVRGLGHEGDATAPIAASRGRTRGPTQESNMEVIPPPSEPDAPPAPATPATRPSGEPDHRAVTIVTIVACVAIIAVIGGAMAIAGGRGDVASATPAAPSPTAVAAPQTMDAHPAAFVVVLTWAQGEGLPVSYYAVTRDGRPITTLKPDTTTWIDRSVTPETRYVYVVAAVGADGARALTRVVTKTPTAALRSEEHTSELQ